MNPILLDTHAAIWSVDGTITKSAAKLIDAAARRSELLLSPVTAWELGILVGKRRITLASSLHDYVRTLFDRAGVVVATMTPAIAVAATTLPGDFHQDPIDRILIATAAAYGAQLVTRDKAIHAYAKATRHVRCLAC